jgi:hypothetical protein
MGQTKNAFRGIDDVTGNEIEFIIEEVNDIVIDDGKIIVIFQDGWRNSFSKIEVVELERKEL